MSGSVYYLGAAETWIAADSAVFNETREAFTDSAAMKYLPLPAANAVLTLSGNQWVGAELVKEVIFLDTADVAALRQQVPKVAADIARRFAEVRERAGLEPRGVNCMLLRPDRAWFYSDAADWREIELPRKFMRDPPLEDRGDIYVRERFEGDGQLVRLLREMKAARPDRHLGGAVIRAHLTKDGIDLARIGDLDHPAEAPARPQAKVGRNAPCPCGSGKKAKKCCQA